MKKKYIPPSISFFDKIIRIWRVSVGYGGTVGGTSKLLVVLLILLALSLPSWIPTLHMPRMIQDNYYQDMGYDIFYMLIITFK
jgi:hypothetical protein